MPYDRPMKVRHLRYFLAVAEHLHFRRAAESLHMAQPPLSARIKDLEQELGCVLFDRTRQGVSLTDAGRALLPLAQQAVDRFDQVLRHTKRDVGVSHPMRVAITPDTTPEAIESFMSSLCDFDPSISLEIIEGNTSQQLDQLRRGEIDIGLLRLPSPTSGLVMGPLLSTPVGALMAANHPLAERAVLYPQDLAKYAIVLFPREVSPEHYDEMITALSTHGLQNATLRHATRIIHSLLLTEHAIALRNFGTVYRSDQQLVWRPIGNNFLRWNTSVAWPTGGQHPKLSACVKALTEALVKHDNWVLQDSAEILTAHAN